MIVYSFASSAFYMLLSLAWMLQIAYRRRMIVQLDRKGTIFSKGYSLSSYAIMGSRLGSYIGFLGLRFSVDGVWGL